MAQRNSSLRSLSVCQAAIISVGIAWETAPIYAQAISATDAIENRFDATQAALDDIATLKVGRHDWPQWGGSRSRVNTPDGHNIPSNWDIETGRNIKWSVELGSVSYGNPVVANGKVFVGTNNARGYLQRLPPSVDLGCLLCFDEQTGDFLWQHSSYKLPTGRVNDWPQQGICSTPVVDGDRLWFVTNRCEVVCLDLQGFQDGENDGPFSLEENEHLDEADVVWKVDMMRAFGVHPHNISNCSPIVVDGKVFVCTSNGVDETHVKIPAPFAPSFIALDRDTGITVWTDNTPSPNVMHGQWGSPSYGIFNGQAQVIFPGGDGWLYSYDPNGHGDGRAKLLWKFDGNPKDAPWMNGGRSHRNSIVGFPAIYDGRVYFCMGEDPEHGEAPGQLWCLDPTRKTDGSDVSPELAVDRDGNLLSLHRFRGINPGRGEKAVPNPNSAMIWHYDAFDQNRDGELKFEETFHRSLGTPAIKDDLLYIVDFSGLFHCLDARNGRPYWTHDLLAACWSSPLVVDGKIFVADEDGDVTVIQHGRNMGLIDELNFVHSIYTTPIVANNVLFIANRSRLFAIATQ